MIDRRQDAPVARAIVDRIVIESFRGGTFVREIAQVRAFVQRSRDERVDGRKAVDRAQTIVAHETHATFAGAVRDLKQSHHSITANWLRSSSRIVMPRP